MKFKKADGSYEEAEYMLSHHTDSITIFMLGVKPTALISLSRDMAKLMSIDLNNGMN